MSVSGAYSLVAPSPFDQSMSFLNPDVEAQSQSSHSSLRIPRRPVSVAASATSSSSLLDHEPSSSGSNTPSNNSDINNFATRFDRRRQFIRLASWGLVRFLITITLIFSLYGTMIGFIKHGLIGEIGKRIIASSFKAIALDMRWYILSRKMRPIEEVNAILACSSLTEVSILGAKSAKKMKPGLVLSCSLWVVFNIATQAAVAMLGLTVSLNPSPSGDPSTPVPGQVIFSNMNQSFGFSLDTDSTEASQLAAHTFGEAALRYEYIDLNYSDPNVLPRITGLSSIYLFPVQEPLHFNDSKNSYLQYVFQETTADNTSTMGYFYSNRSIVTTSHCMVYTVKDNLNGSSQSFQFQKDGKVQTQNFSSVAANSTTYFTQPNMGDCGPRCANVYAYENNGSKGWYYECAITVSNVSNAMKDEHRVSDANAKMAAGAIALQGYQANIQDSQYQRFPAQSNYGMFLDGDNSTMAYNMRQFAIGVFAAADLSLSNIDREKVKVQGFLPDQGLVLSIDHWIGMWAIFGTIIGCHCVLFTVAAWIASKVVVVDDDYLAIALLLRPVAEEMKDQGGLLDRKQRERLGSDMEVIFGPKLSEKMQFGGDGVRKLEISSEAEYQRHSEGWERYFDS